MRKILVLLVTVLLLCHSLRAQSVLSEDERLASLCKVWGFLKYYHPEVGKGRLDWDQELISHVPLVIQAQSREQLDHVYAGWIRSLGKVKPRRRKLDTAGMLRYNLDREWMDDRSMFSDSLSQALHSIMLSKHSRKNYYVGTNIFVGNTTYGHEKAYEGMAYPEVPYRLLSLFRFWNIINYFYPYKYIIGEDWSKVLTDMIPKFRDAKDTMAYHLAMLELVGRLNDSHATLVTPYTSAYFGVYAMPFQVKLIDGKAIVIRGYNDSLCRLDDIRYGDVIVKVNDTPVSDMIRKHSKYISASNEAAKLRKISYVILNGATDTVRITYDRNGVLSSKTIHRYLFKDMKYVWKPDTDVWRFISPDIGYINMGILKPRQVAGIMAKLHDTKAIIIDIRNYPEGSMYALANHLNPRIKSFAKFSYPIMWQPGLYAYTSPYKCGLKNNNYYKGQVILLFDERTQSHAEFSCMALQTAPKVVCIGSQTSGADGNVSIITFPGGYKVYMTGIGVFYPDGRQTQRIGIVPDIEAKPTIEGIRSHMDEVLERAITYIRTGK